MAPPPAVAVTSDNGRAVLEMNKQFENCKWDPRRAITDDPPPRFVLFSNKHDSNRTVLFSPTTTADDFPRVPSNSIPTI